MIVPQPQAPSATYFGDIQANRVGIDTKNIDFVTSLLTTNLYSFPIQSFLRETISNGWDSHVEAGNKEPLIVTLDSSDPSYLQQIRDRSWTTPKSSCTLTISIRDFGTGVSPERFNTIYRNIGSSTKRESNDYIGMFGIGRFSCLSCADSAIITSYYNNIKYSYLMYKDGKGINIDKLGEVQGVFKSGLEVSVTVAGTRENLKDVREGFQQLVFFEGIFIHDPYTFLNGYAETFNKRKVKHFKNFAIRSNPAEYPEIQLLVGNCTYPLNKELWTLGFDSKNYPLYIKFNIGELDVTPNREAILYNPKSEALIRDRIIAAAKELRQLLEDNKFFTFTSLPAYMEFSQGYKVAYPINDDDEVIVKFGVTSQLCKLWGVQDNDITLCGMRVPTNFHKVITSLYSQYVPQSLIKFVFRDGKYWSSESEKKRVTVKALLYALERDKTHIICTDENRWNQALKQYVKEEVLTDSILHRYCYSGLDFGYILNKASLKSFILKILRTAVKLERNSGYTTGATTKLVFHYIKNLPKMQTINASDVPDEYKTVATATPKTVAAAPKKEKEIAVGVLRKSDKYDYVESCYQPVRDCNQFTWNELQKSSQPFIYSSTDSAELEELKALFRILADVSQEDNFRFVSVAPSVIPKVQALPHGKTVTEFIYSNNNILRKLVTIDKDKFKRILNTPQKLSEGIEGLERTKKLLNKYTKYTNTSVYKTKQESVINLWNDIKKLYSDKNWYDFNIKSIQDDDNLLKVCRLLNDFRYVELEGCFPLYYYIHQTKLAKLNSTGRQYLLLKKNY